MEDLFHASDNDLLSILSEADDLDEVIADQRSQPVSLRKADGDSSLEVVILGSLGCRLGMLRGGAGGFLVRSSGKDLLVDPGPGALYLLSRLTLQERFCFANLDAVLCSHIHTDHVTDVLPCIEGMTGGMRVTRGHLIGNKTVIEKLAAFSAYHIAKVKAVALTARADGVSGELRLHDELQLSRTEVGGVLVSATPTHHLEEKGNYDTGIGFLIEGPEAAVWYTGDTSLFDELLQRVESMTQQRSPTLIIANADASDVGQRPGKAAVCHLLTRDVIEIARSVNPSYILIQHYDEAYSSARYRIAQAIYLQRRIDELGLSTTVLPSADGLYLSFSSSQLRNYTLYFESDEGPAVGEYLERTLHIHNPC